MVIRIAEHRVLQRCFQFITAGLKRQICNAPANHAANNGNSLLEKAREELLRHIHAEPLRNAFYDRVNRPFCECLAKKLFFHSAGQCFCHCFQSIIRAGRPIHDAHANNQDIHSLGIKSMPLFFHVDRRKSIQIHKLLRRAKHIAIILRNIRRDRCCHSNTAGCAQSRGNSGYANSLVLNDRIRNLVDDLA